MEGAHRPQIDSSRYDAVIFDMDGVITDTAGVHAEAWKRLFDDVLHAHSWRTGERFSSFDAVDDYLRYVDGISRADGVRTFLASRGIMVPEGSVDDPPDAETVHGLGRRKNGYFLESLAERGATAFPAAVRLLGHLRESGVATAVISASRNAERVLDAAGVSDLFDARVDGTLADELGLPGKPDAAVFLEAARRLGVEPARAVVVEDAEAGVTAGAAGGFGLVIGVDHNSDPARLLENGADVVVAGLEEVAVLASRPMTQVPAALDRWAEIEAIVDGRTPAVFLDYDGTLTPIVERPEDALLDESMREQIRSLAARCLVSVVSGRDVAFVIEQVAVDEVLYLGSHGFDVVVPPGWELSHELAGEFARFLKPLASAEEALEGAVSGIAGARIERKKYAIAVHYRQVAAADVAAVEAAVDSVLEGHPQLRKTGGKKVFELRPDIDWDKGRALSWVLETMQLGLDAVVPFYIGDDLTDEDAFAAVLGHGIAIVVGDEARPTVAGYRVADTAEVAEVLKRISALAAGGGR